MTGSDGKTEGCGGPKSVLLAVYVRLRYAQSAAYLSCPSPVIHDD